MRIATWCLLSVLLGGCALFAVPADELRVSRGEFAVIWADLHAAYATLLYRHRQACRAGHLPPDVCKQGEDLHAKAVDIKREGDRLLRRPDIEPDWQRLGTLLSVVIGLATLAPGPP